MSYCRFSHNESDVYLYPHIGGFICCCSCRLNPKVTITKYTHHPDEYISTVREALKHLNKHIAAGHLVPDYAISRLKEELKNE